MESGPALHEVFGIPPNVRKHSYVDRGNLDQRLAYALSTQRHVIIHGDSKQGKTWLGQQALAGYGIVRVQCQTDATPASIFTELLGRLGVKAELKQTTKSELQGTLDLSGSGEIGPKLLSRFKVAAKAGAQGAMSTEKEVASIGQTAADLGWVAAVLAESGSRVVIEDFHYLQEASRKDFAFLLKALGEYGVFPVIVGVWPQDHLLTYYNGDLSGRIEDIHLSWKPEELERVLQQGSKALNIVMSKSLRSALVSDAYGNVGTLQALAEALCRHEGIYVRSKDPRYLTPGESLDQSRNEIAAGMGARFEGFADAFLAGVQMLQADERTVFGPVIETLSSRSDDELLDGVSVDSLPHSAVSMARRYEILNGLERFQSAIEISPLVLTFNRHLHTVSLVDRRLLFFRRYGRPHWPWAGGKLW